MNDELEKLKSLLYIGSLTQYGKRKLIKTYEDIIKEKDKQIDLMVEYISNLDIDEDICKKVENNCDDFNKENKCIDCVKQYFKRLVKEKGE